VKVELEQNDALLALYGPMRGEVWTTTKITLRDGAASRRSAAARACGGPSILIGARIW